MNTVDYYDSNTDRYIKDTLHLSMYEFCETFISLLPNNARILDAGCGSGRDTRFFIYVQDRRGIECKKIL
jgi:hypothetical protein